MQAPLCPGCLTRLPLCQTSGGRVGTFALVSPFLYEGIARELALALKYRGRLAVAPFLGNRMAKAVRERFGGAAESVVPIPLHPTRLRERTFNQAELLARHLAAELGLPCDAGLLVRRKATRPQTELDRDQRAANVREAFALAPGAQDCVRGRRLLLVDDVLTTGFTASACAELLMKAGARNVTVVTAAFASQ